MPVHSDMNPKAIFFDFDGTLADTAACIVATMKATFQEMGLSEPTETAIRQSIGLPLSQSLKRVGPINDSTVQEAADIYHKHFARLQSTHIVLFPKVVETLNTLKKKGFTLAIVTSRGQDSLQEIMEAHALKDYFQACMTSDLGLASKPAPDMVLALLRRFGLSPEQAWVVGDTTFDIQMGNSAGCTTVGVTYGNHSREQLQSVSATHLIDRFEELLEL